MALTLTPISKGALTLVAVAKGALSLTAFPTPQFALLCSDSLACSDSLPCAEVSVDELTVTPVVVS